MFYRNIIVVFSLLVGVTAMADVTPAPLALTKVQAFLVAEANRIIEHQVLIHKFTVHPVATSIQLTRGKFSDDPAGSAHYFGSLEQSYDRDSRVVHCRLFAKVKVVPFAMQAVPVLESEVNHQDLIVSKHIVKCETN